MHDDDDSFIERSLVPIDHIPLCPARDCPPGEAIYLSLWQEFATKRPEAWADVFVYAREPITQRDASVAASFMVWMGNQNGNGFTREAIDASSGSHQAERDRIFLSTWALWNRRNRSSNCGLRTIEYMLAPVHPIDPNGSQVAWDRVPDVTQRDIDIIESMVVWWGSQQGADMRKIAKLQMEADAIKQRSGLFTYQEPTI